MVSFSIPQLGKFLLQAPNGRRTCNKCVTSQAAMCLYLNHRPPPPDEFNYHHLERLDAQHRWERMSASPRSSREVVIYRRLSTWPNLTAALIQTPFSQLSTGRGSESLLALSLWSYNVSSLLIFFVYNTGRNTKKKNQTTHLTKVTMQCNNPPFRA